MHERIVVVGASLAGASIARTLRREGFDGEVLVVGAEACPPYDRPPLSKEFLTHSAGVEAPALPVAADLEVTWRLGVRADNVDLAGRVLRLGEETVAFDGLAVATGVRPRRLPVVSPNGVDAHELRTVEDARRLRDALAAQPRLLVVGSGFIGVEVASVARDLGCEVNMVSLDPPLAVAGPSMSGVCARMLGQREVVLHIGRGIARRTATRSGTWVAELDDGTAVEHDVVLVAVGTTPNVEWLRGSGLTLDDGVLCDAWSAAVGARNVVAAGDVARWPNPAFGGRLMRVEHWSNAVEQGAAAARTLLHGSGQADEYCAVPSFWSDHCGTRLQSVGLPTSGDRLELVEGTYEDERFAVAAYAGDVLVGGLGYGAPRPLARLRAQLSARATKPRTKA